MTNITGNGGAREGAGRPRGKRTKAQKDYADAKARHELIRADRAQLAHERDLTKYVSREALAAAVETTIATFTDAANSMSARTAEVEGVSPAVVTAVQTATGAALAALISDLRKISHPL